MVREAEKRDLDGILELYLYLHEDGIPETDMHLEQTWEQIISDPNHHLIVNEVQWLVDNNITTIVDLREEKEYKVKSCTLETENGFTFFHMPVTGGGDTPCSPEAVAETYLGMIDAQMDKIISTIMNANTNVMYFCGAGKDKQF